MKNEPKKKRKVWVWLWVLLLLVAVIFGVSLFMILREVVFLPAQSDSLNDELRTIARAEETASKNDDDEKTDTERDPLVDFKALLEVNSDIVGWIQVPNTVIDYPVLQSSEDDPEYYLYRDYKRQDTKYGSVFLNSLNSVDLSKRNSKCMTLYGHHMNDGRMFAAILQFADLDFYCTTPTFSFDTTESTGDWKVISVFKTNIRSDQGEVFEYVRPDFADDDDFLNFVYQVRIRSIINTPVTVNEDDQLVVLSTCSYEYDDFRTVVVARKVRDGESTEVDTKKASYNSDPLYPDCWYTSGLTKPSYPKTFAKAMKKGVIDWYDGDLETETES
jgi:sortase B